jgi:hypothetical protein
MVGGPEPLHRCSLLLLYVPKTGLGLGGRAHAVKTYRRAPGARLLLRVRPWITPYPSLAGALLPPHPSPAPTSCPPTIPPLAPPSRRPPVCADVNECTAGGAFALVCDPHATCVNTAGSAHCLCNSGYVGNGQSCVSGQLYYPLTNLPPDMTW